MKDIKRGYLEEEGRGKTEKERETGKESEFRHLAGETERGGRRINIEGEGEEERMRGETKERARGETEGSDIGEKETERKRRM
jgi:hypothetical protein